MKFYEWSQNNSGGGFDVNDKVTHRVFIEASTKEEAEDKAASLGIYYDGVLRGRDCDCCGDRWYYPDELEFPMKWDNSTVLSSVEEYAQWMADKYGWCKPDAYIYYNDGTKKEIYKKKRKYNA